MQHLSYEGQLEYKTKLVRDALEMIGHFENIKVLPAIGMDHPLAIQKQSPVPCGAYSRQACFGLLCSQKS